MVEKAWLNDQSEAGAGRTRSKESGQMAGEDSTARPGASPAVYRYKAFLSYSHAADGELAPALENALRRFAKPWYRLRAMRVFRDKTGLGVTPALWPSIEQALLESEYFLLLASPQSAHSKWVGEEIDCWMRNRTPSRLLIIQTHGEIRWSDAAADFDWSASSALSPRLAKAFPEEPYYIDVRWARSAADLSTRKPEFLEAIAKLSAALRNRAVDELIGEDVRQHRKTMLLVRSAVATLILLLVVAVLAAVIAVQQRNTAQVQRRIAEERTEQSRQRLVRLNVANGIRQQEAGDLSASLIWLAEALKLEQTAAHSSPTQRIRLATFLRQHPQLTRVWPSPKAIKARFTEDGRRVEASTEDGVMLWDTQTGAALPSPPPAGSNDGITRDALKVLSDNTVQVWRGKGPKVLLKHARPVILADLSSNGRWVLTIDEFRSLRLFDAGTGRYLSSMGGWEWVDYAEFSPAGDTAVLASREGWASVWDVVRDAEVTEVRHQGSLIHATFSSDSKRIATASSDRTARVWDARTGAPLSPPLHHGDAVSQVAFDRQGTRLLTVSADGLIRVWDLASPLPQTLKHEGSVRHAAFSPDEKRILTITDSAAQLWNVETGLVAALKMPRGQVHFGDFSPDGRVVVTGAADGAARLWDAATGSPLQTLPHDRRVEYADVSLDGRRMVTASGAEMVVWDVANARRIAVVRHESPIITVRFDRGGRRILSREFGGPAHVWQADQVDKFTELLQVPETNLVLFSPDGTGVAAASSNTVQIVDASSGKTISRMTTSERVIHLAFRPDGLRLATAGSNSSARIFDVASGAPVTPPLTHDARVLHVAFSPNGTQLLTASEDRSARLWDATTGEPLSPPLRHADAVGDAAFSSSGRRVVTSSLDETARVWDVSDNIRVDRIQALCQLLSARRVDETGAMVVLDQPAFLATWQQVQDSLRASR